MVVPRAPGGGGYCPRVEERFDGLPSLREFPCSDGAGDTSWVWDNNTVRMSNVFPIKSFGMSLKGESSDWGEQGLL